MNCAKNKQPRRYLEQITAIGYTQARVAVNASIFAANIP
jgi:hypothetical protein